MDNTRKIKRRGKFRAPDCDSPACSHNHVAGAAPTDTYLDVIPEARALYDAHRGKRKITQPENTDRDPGVTSWKRHRETRAIPRRTERPMEDESSEDEVTSGEEEDEAPHPMPRLPSYPFPVRKLPGRRRKPSYRDVIDMDTATWYPFPAEVYTVVTETIDVIMEDFRLKDDTYREVMRLLDEEMGIGLRKDSHRQSTVRMYPTYVRSIPDGTETGRFLALDLGGTNFRVLLVDLKGDQTPETRSQIFLIPNRIMLGHGQLLFDHIASCINQFLEKEKLKGEALPLGFTFSFPCAQEGLAAARLVRWTKGFKCAGVEGEDVVRLLHEAVARKNLSVNCLAVINDPVGALMAAAHTDKKCRVGLILGTGTNSCYLEDLDKVEMWDGDHNEPKQVVVNTEWGAFGDNGVLGDIRNIFDKQLDTGSLNPGHQLFEKMISGMYMGELVRLVLCECCLQGLIFDGQGSEELFTPQRFYTKYISEIESDDPNGNFSKTKMVLQELDIPTISTDDCRHTQHVCWQVSQRAAFLAATAVATLVNRLSSDDITVAVDGSLYRFHPHFNDLMQKKVTQLINPGKKFSLKLAHDGSGIGAALVAAVAKRMKDTTPTTNMTDTETTTTTHNNNNSELDKTTKRMDSDQPFIEAMA